MTVPSAMYAVICPEPGGPDKLMLVERPIPQPGPGEVLIKVAAAGINRPDVGQRQGNYPPPPGASDVLGLEVAGDVIEIGEGVDPVMSGMPVCALLAGGGYAGYAVAPAGQCLPVPASLSMIEAAAMPETLFTVWANLFQCGHPNAGDTVLVHGGTSGIGTMAIGLAKLFGLTMIVTCGSDEKCEAARRFGADRAINYRTHDFVEEVRRIRSGQGVSVVLDMVGGDYVARNLACLGEEGRHISIAIQRGPTAEIPIFTIMRKRLTLTGSTLRPRSIEFKASLAEELERAVWPHVIDGRLKPVIDSVYPLADVNDAHARMDNGAHIGKIMLEIS